MLVPHWWVHRKPAKGAESPVGTILRRGLSRQAIFMTWLPAPARRAGCRMGRSPPDARGVPLRELRGVSTKMHLVGIEEPGVAKAIGELLRERTVTVDHAGA